MDTHLLKIFQHEVERQTRFALLAVSDLSTALASHDTDRIWYSVQALLIAAGNVSKLLWPPNSTIQNRGEELRRSLSVPDDSVLAPRVFRNHFEHFDERLEAWAASSKRRNFVDSNVGPTGAIAGLDPLDYLRNFDPTTFAMTFRGDTYHLRPIIDALIDLHDRASTETAKPLG